MTLRANCLVNPLWIVVITYVKMINGVYMWQLHVNWNMDVVGDCIYVMWWWIVVDCIYTKSWWCWGDCMCEHMHLELSHMFMHSWLMVVDFISNWGDYDVFVASEVTYLEVIWYHMHLDESRVIAYFVGELKCIWVVNDDWIY
jgi:hypothetical protein